MRFCEIAYFSYSFRYVLRSEISRVCEGLIAT